MTRREQDKILSCLYCEKKFNYINSYVIHLVSELQCYRQFVHAAQAHGTPDLGKVKLKYHKKIFSYIPNFTNIEIIFIFRSHFVDR